MTDTPLEYRGYVKTDPRQSFPAFLLDCAERYAERTGQSATVALVAAGEVCEVAGLTVIASARIQKGNVQLGCEA